VETEFLESPGLTQVATNLATASASSVLPAGTQLGPYVLQALLGAGGMGEVYRARDIRLDRTVAIKLIPLALSSDPTRQQRFEREARAISSLNHPHICHLYDVGEQDGLDYLVMEYLEGETLATRLQKGALSLDLTLRYATEVADALNAAHRRGIVHRDLKPGNIFITTHGESKVLDFGLAKLDEPEVDSDRPTAPGKQPEILTTPGVAMGTVAYMSPEQARGEELDGRTDIFSLGAVLYEMATGKVAFPGRTSAVVFKAILDETPKRASEIDPALPAQLDQMVEKALEKDRNLRYQHTTDLRTDLLRLRRDTTSGRAAIANKRSRSSESAPTAHSWRKWLAVASALSVVVLGLALAFRLSKQPLPAIMEMTQRQLTANTADNPVNSAAISRDGKYLAYADDNGVSIEEIDSGDTHKLPNTTGLHAGDWYSDNLHLLVTDDDENLWSLFAFSGERHKLSSQVTAAKISPDGSQIMLFRNHAPRELWTMPAAGGEPQVRAAFRRDEFITDADWSPDGKAVTYIRSPSSGPASLEIRNLGDEKARTSFTDPQLALYGSAMVNWLPDNRILFALDKGRLTESDLWTLPLGSDAAPMGKPIPLTSTFGASFMEGSVSRDGKHLAVSVTRELFITFIANLSEAGEKLERPMRLTTDSSWPRTWSLDGQALFYRSVRGAAESLYRHHVSPNSTELFLSLPERLESATESPDGAWLIVATSEGNKWQLLRVPISSGGAPESILVLAGLSEIQCAPSGLHICLLSELIGRQLVFSSFDPVRGQREELTRIDVSQGNPWWSLSRDGMRVALVENLSDRIRILDLKSKQIQVIHPNPPQTDLQYLAWSADGQKLFVTRFPRGKGRLLKVGMDGRVSVMLENRHGWIGCPLPSPDGKRIAYIYAFNESNVTLLEHF
jgi:serine/threonine protein kinase